MSRQTRASLRSGEERLRAKSQPPKQSVSQPGTEVENCIQLANTPQDQPYQPSNGSSHGVTVLTTHICQTWGVNSLQDVLPDVEWVLSQGRIDEGLAQRLALIANKVSLETGRRLLRAEISERRKKIAALVASQKPYCITESDARGVLEQLGLAPKEKRKTDSPGGSAASPTKRAKVSAPVPLPESNGRRAQLHLEENDLLNLSASPQVPRSPNSARVNASLDEAPLELEDADVVVTVNLPSTTSALTPNPTTLPQPRVQQNDPSNNTASDFRRGLKRFMEDEINRLNRELTAATIESQRRTAEIDRLVREVGAQKDPQGEISLQQSRQAKLQSAIQKIEQMLESLSNLKDPLLEFLAPEDTNGDTEASDVVPQGSAHPGLPTEVKSAYDTIVTSLVKDGISLKQKLNEAKSRVTTIRMATSELKATRESATKAAETLHRLEEEKLDVDDSARLLGLRLGV